MSGSALSLPLLTLTYSGEGLKILGKRLAILTLSDAGGFPPKVEVNNVLNFAEINIFQTFIYTGVKQLLVYIDF